MKTLVIIILAALLIGGIAWSMDRLAKNSDKAFNNHVSYPSAD